MIKTAGVHMLALLALLVLAPPARAQSGSGDITALRADIARRFDILPLRDGIALRPKTEVRGVRSIEVTRGPVAIDGQPATGAELRDKLGADADLILRLSYLSDADRRVFLGAAAPAAPPAAVDTPPSSENRPPDTSSRPRRRARGSGGDDRVHIGSGVTVRAGEVVDGDVVAVGGSAEVDGEVHGDVVAVGGNVRLGPTAVVANNVVVVGGRLNRDPGAQVDGQVQEVGLGLNFSNMRWPSMSIGPFSTNRSTSALRAIGTLTRAAILCLLAALVVLLGRTYAERAGERAAINPLKAGVIGVLAQLLFLPVLLITIVVLCITIVGIPLLLLIPFVILGLAIVGLVGFTGVAQRVGTVISERMGWARDSYYTTTIVGILVLVGPVVLARLLGVTFGGILFPITTVLFIAGLFLEYLAWTIGFGAMALLRFDRRPHTSDAPVFTPPPA